MGRCLTSYDEEGREGIGFRRHDGGLFYAESLRECV